MELANKYKTLLKNNGINTQKRLTMFFAQLDHESGLKPISENLNYSADGLLKTFGKYFNKETAKEYARQPQKIANRVYANRMGNGSESSGDGWKFRGRGFIQLTGKNNYIACGYAHEPDKLLNEADAMIVALWFWNQNNLNKFADSGDVKGCTRIINGGLNGLADRERLYKKYLEVFK